jgi:hypothetical protein
MAETKTRTAFSRAIMTVLDATINTLHHSMAQLIKSPLTNKEIAVHLIKKEDMPLLIRAKELGLRSGVWRDVAGLKIHDIVTVNIDMSVLDIPLPKYVDNGVMKDIELPDNIKELLATFASKRLAVSEHWTKVRALVGHLDDNCMSPQQVRYLLPCVIGLLAYDSKTAPLARRITPMPHLRNPPSVSPNVRDAIAEVQRTVTQGLLIPKNLPPEYAPEGTPYLTFSGSILYEGWGAMPVHEKRLSIGVR